MGSPLLPIIADYTGSWRNSDPKITVVLLFYFRYDDIVLASSLGSTNEILEIFNSLHIRLQFTMEIGIDDKLSFLVIMIIDNHKIIFNRYQKIICSGRFLNFLSHYLSSHKKDVVLWIE